MTVPLEERILGRKGLQALRGCSLALVAGMPALLHAPLLLKNFLATGWWDVAVLIPAVCLLLWCVIRTGPGIRSVTGSISWTCVSSRTLLVSLLLLVVVHSCGTVGGALAGRYAFVTGTIDAVRLALFTVLGLCLVAAVSRDDLLRWLVTGLVGLVAANFALHWIGVSNDLVNAARDLGPGLLWKNECRVLSWLGLDVPRPLFPLGDAHSALGLPFGLALVGCWVHLCWRRDARRSVVWWAAWILSWTGVLLLDRIGVIAAALLAHGFALLWYRGSLRRVQEWLVPAIAALPLLLSAVVPLLVAAWGLRDGQRLHSLVTASERVHIWGFYLSEIFPAVPPWGMGCYGFLAFEGVLKNRLGEFADPHNQFLTAYLATGVLGVLAHFGVGFFALRAARDRPVLATLLAYLVIAGLTEATFGFNQQVATFVLILLALIALRPEDPSRTPGSPRWNAEGSP